MRIFLATLGCPKNTVDSENLAALLESAGHRLVDAPQRADVILVNTCGFIEPARQESLEALRTFSRRKRRGQYLVAAGCLAQRWGERLSQAVPGIDGLLGTRRWSEVNDLLEALKPAASHSDAAALLGDSPAAADEPAVQRMPQGASAYLKIADGCSAPCAFCAIPQIKGPARSRPLERIVAEARGLVQAGVRELILVAQDTTAYGRDAGQREGLPELIEAILSAAPDLHWLRLMYAYPQQISPRLIDVMASHPQMCHYLDLPLQHGHPDVLRRMRRPHDVEAVLRQIEALRTAMPDIALRTSLIVGFPGETEDEFAGLLDFVEALSFDRVGAFPFSLEEDTPAAELPGRVPQEIIQERYEQVMVFQQPISLLRNQAQIGRRLDMLVEGAGDGLSVGRTYRDAPEIDGMALVEEERETGTLASFMVTTAGEYDLWGTWEPAAS